MKDIIKEIRLSLGQVIVVIANMMVVMTWGIKLDADVAFLKDTTSRIEATVNHNTQEIQELEVELAGVNRGGEN